MERAAAIVQTASSTRAATKNAAEALVNQASTTAQPAKIPRIGRRCASTYALQLATMKAVIVDSMSAARFHMTKT